MNLSIKENACCFSGHRTSDLPRDTRQLDRRLYAAIERLVNQGVTAFITGGAVGFDTMAALSVLDMRKKNKDIRLILYLPCKGQEAR